MESAYPNPLQWVWKKLKHREGKPEMLYIGLDVHSKWMTIKGFDPETGDLVEIKKQSNDEDSLRERFGSFAGPLHGVMESGILGCIQNT